MPLIDSLILVIVAAICGSLGQGIISDGKTKATRRNNRMDEENCMNKNYRLNWTSGRPKLTS